MVSHSLEDAQQIAPRSLVVVDGRIYWDGSTASLISGESEAAAILGVKKP